MTTADKSVTMGDANIDPNKGAADDKTKDADKGAAKTEKVTLGGKEFELPVDVAAAVKAATTEGVAAKDLAQQLKTQLDEIQKKLNPDSKDKGDGKFDYATELFRNPEAAIAKLKAEILDEAAAKTNSSDAQKAFWSTFYEENPELKQDDLVVRAVMARDMDELSTLKVADAAKKLAENTQKYLLERGVKREKGKKTPQTEGGNEPGGKKTKQDDVSESSPSSGGMTAILKARQAARAAARRGALTGDAA